MNVIECKPVEWLRKNFQCIDEFGENYVKSLSISNGRLRFLHCEDIYVCDVENFKNFYHNVHLYYDKFVHLIPIEAEMDDYRKSFYRNKRYIPAFDPIYVLHQNKDSRCYQILDILETVA